MMIDVDPVSRDFCFDALLQIKQSIEAVSELLPIFIGF
jgi:hypothetical protein